jgi:hypothetical protein
MKNILTKKLKKKKSALISKNLLWAISSNPDADHVELTVFDNASLTVPRLLRLIEDLAGHARRLSR